VFRDEANLKALLMEVGGRRAPHNAERELVRGLSRSRASRRPSQPARPPRTLAEAATPTVARLTGAPQARQAPAVPAARE
jgi:hypothetical protein